MTIHSVFDIGMFGMADVVRRNMDIGALYKLMGHE